MTSWLTPELSLCGQVFREGVAEGKRPSGKICLGFDLGTTNMVLVALDEEGFPIGAVMEPSKASVRDGVVVDYLEAIRGMKACLDRLSREIPIDESVTVGAAAYPPGISSKTAKVCANVVEALGFECGGLYEEPSAAAEALGMSDGVIVDIGGGTTGISVVRDEKVIFSSDEPTGGTHMTLVLAGALGIDFDRAEEEKRKNRNRYAPLLKPVLEKMATIVRNGLKRCPESDGLPVVLVGGGADIVGVEDVMKPIIGRPVSMAPETLLVTPLGIARSLWRNRYGSR
ncbi:ethanolamine utilization protein EutJ [Dethiosulfovibrio sp. F2B]|uniref:ethanolamine utilization protein EutJ n=1 Tax=Dethiosulfovibrio faecalis TaxID=2720018 RepID=UPI001F32E48C|nr:ethanolamine utilization protein EutJ [Dethiosulfovibrio faecalis]MCF4151928.1 ethanolamine utilization protein EutJ [Dethiosulfovibrio faecalis]